MAIDNHGNKDAQLHSHGDEHGHGSLRSYLIGFLLSVALTAVPFWLVMGHPLASGQATALIIIAFAIAQIAVHTIFFLHVTTSGEGGWTLMAFMFTVVLVLITLVGSVWVMYHLNTSMMPMSAGEMGQMP